MKGKCYRLSAYLSVSFQTLINATIILYQAAAFDSFFLELNNAIWVLIASVPDLCIHFTYITDCTELLRINGQITELY